MHGTSVLVEINHSWLALENMHGTFVQPITVKRKRRTQPCLPVCIKGPAPHLFHNMNIAKSKDSESSELHQFSRCGNRSPFTSTRRFLPIVVLPYHLSESLPARTLSTPNYWALLIIICLLPTLCSLSACVMATTLCSSNDVSAPAVTSVTRSNGWATKESWASHQARIKQLYLYEKKPLAEVIRLMESQHGFRATLVHRAALLVSNIANICRVKMYKTHIKEWGLDKKNKEVEMRAIVRKSKHRADQRKGSIIRVRGQLRDFAEVVRYWDRKGVSIDDIIARQTASPTPETVELFTPVPSPILTPQALAIPERMFRCIRDYFTSSFESGTWVRTEPLSHCSTIKDEAITAGNYIEELALPCGLACSLFKRNLFHEAGQTLIAATAKIKKIVSAEHPESLIDLFWLIVHVRCQKRDEMALIILRHFSALGKVLLGSQHPLSRIYEWIDSVFASDFDDVVTRCVESMADQFESIVGPLHQSTLSSRLTLINIVAWNGNLRIEMMHKLLSECENSLQPYDVRLLRIRWSLAEEYFATSHYVEAITLSQKNIACSQRVQSIDIMLQQQIEGLYMTARCQYALGEVGSGIATLHKAIDSYTSRWAPQDSLTRKWLVVLEDWYLEQDRWDLAAQVRRRRKKILESMDMD